MPDLFGQTQVLPSWLQDDSANRAAQGFQIGAQIASTVNQNRQRAVENQRADRRLSLEEQQAQTNRLLTEAQIEGQRLKLDDAHAFAEDTPKILALGEQLQKAQSLDEVDKVGPLGLKSYQGQQAAEKVIEVHRGRLAQKRLQNFGQMFDTKVQDFTLANGRPPNEEERRVISSDTFMRVDPESWAKSILPQQVRADASLNAAQIRAESAAEIQRIKDEAAQNKPLLVSIKNQADREAKADATIKAFKDSGIPLGADEPSVRSQLVANNSSVGSGTLPQKTAQAIETDELASDQTKDVVARMEAFDSKYGKGAWASVSGPINNRVLKLKKLAVSPDKQSEAEAEATQLFADANTVLQGYKTGRFGLAQTPSEMESFKAIVSEPTNSNYKEALAGFEKQLRKGVANAVWRNRFKSGSNFDLIKKYAPANAVRGYEEDNQSAAEGGSPVAASVSATTPAGTVNDFVIMVNPSGASVRVPRARVEEARSKGYK